MFSHPFKFRSRRPRRAVQSRRVASEVAPSSAGSLARGLLIGSGLVGSALLCMPTSAQAALVSSGGACAEPAVSEPFARWGDNNSYVLAPEGGFEGSLAEWTLAGGAARVSGSESYGVSGTVGQYALGLPSGASAQSPYMCVDASDPTFRFFARASTALTTLAVAVVYKTALGPIALPLGVSTPSGEWEPMQPMLTASSIAGLLSGGTAQLALRFTTVAGAATIDDVYVDPRMR
ncbi:MAG TPA: hypothetical protein VK756_09060 [Solirubrobacteraceae bacterium]|nr:hypothetical protein [Solirubrobacteraceae bacterium]